MTHTFAIMDLSANAWTEIRTKLVDAGYDHAIMREGGREVLDMHGIAVRMEAKPPHPSLAGALPLVLYFRTAEDRQELIDAAIQSGMTSHQVVP